MNSILIFAAGFGTGFLVALMLYRIYTRRKDAQKKEFEEKLPRPRHYRAPQSFALPRDEEPPPAPTMAPLPRPPAPISPPTGAVNALPPHKEDDVPQFRSEYERSPNFSRARGSLRATSNNVVPLKPHK